MEGKRSDENKGDWLTIRNRVVVRGIVQGVGFRPFIHRTAHEHTLTGWVLNSTEGVIIEVEGPEKSIQGFVTDITAKAPPLAVVERVEVTQLPPVGYQSFTIASSQSNEAGFVLVSPDVCVCPDCLRETLDPNDRRYRYPFTNCTNCGPRFTIIQDIPYDRPKTTMKDFDMCPTCAAEYHDPTNRRFHAQPNACAECGPQVWLQTGKISNEQTPTILAERDEALRQARKLLAEGKILAIKGLGGFHLACDATNDAAVNTLRERKQRVDKPFAVMAYDAETVLHYCELSMEERQLLESPQRPIVLLRRKAGSPISEQTAPGNRYLGVMLPYTPLHYLLLEQDESAPMALVMTSGNISEEPLAITNEDALERLSPLADAFLMHDRAIHIRCDDSVTKLYEGQEMMLRRSRGYAPYPVRLRFAEAQETLGCGGELKNTFCLVKGNYAFLSQHIGDLQNYETLRSYEQAIEHFKNLFRVNPTVVAYDLHPEYLSTKYALELAEKAPEQIQLVAVQHHEAHIASCMAENEVYEPVIGVAFDGTGYGRDGNIWGGEFFAGDFRSFRRMAHLSYVPMPGGELAIRRPYRMAFSYLHQAFGDQSLSLDISMVRDMDSVETKLMMQQIARGINAPLTSSGGRLFDAVAALLNIRTRVNYEGQAAIEMEMLADRKERGCYQWEPHTTSDGLLIVDTNALIRAIVDDLTSGLAVPSIAAKFHNSLAEMIGQVCSTISKQTGLKKVALGGGVFQNTLLLDRTLYELRRRELQLLLHHQVPTNDGGLSLGQIMIANASLPN
jgi:hydrogenase maturation protein HypF